MAVTLDGNKPVNIVMPTYESASVASSKFKQPTEQTLSEIFIYLLIYNHLFNQLNAIIICSIQIHLNKNYDYENYKNYKKIIKTFERFSN